MKPARILYIDRHGVIVTKNTLKVKKQSYILNAIKEHELSVLPPERITGLLLFSLGMIFIACNFLNLISPTLQLDVGIEDHYINANNAVLYGGAALLSLGLIRMIKVRERYALRIATSEGEENAIISNKKEYIGRIINALNNALLTNEYSRN
jgi:hypothetical protein